MEKQELIKIDEGAGEFFRLRVIEHHKKKNGNEVFIVKVE